MEKLSLIGRKIRGFKFKKVKLLDYSNQMDEFIGKKGIIDSYSKNTDSYTVLFDKDQWHYPAELIAEHLIDEENRKLPEKGIIIEVTEANGNLSYNLESYKMTAIESLGLLSLITEQIKDKLNNQNPAI